MSHKTKADRKREAKEREERNDPATQLLRNIFGGLLMQEADRAYHQNMADMADLEDDGYRT